MRTSLLAGAMVMAAMTANAAEIKYEGNHSGVNAISIIGTILPGDGNKFRNIARPLTAPTLVVLSSPGGSVVDGLMIGTTIQTNGYTTGVPDHKMCTSTCGLIWLAGKERFISSTSEIGFHAAYNRDNGETSGTANALIGVYLNGLGFSFDVIAFVTKAGPDQMTWLHPDDAKRLGITYRVANADDAPAPRVPAQSTALLPSQTPAYQQGRAARLDYEQWFAKLDGDFKNGAQFWATHRSEKPPPVCGGSLQFFAGCVAAKTKLAPIDQRRTAEKDYWFGWNSL